MVKSAYILASLTTVFSVVMTQEATPTASGITIPTAIPSNLSLPTEIADVVSSLIRNPSGINSYISVPPQNQASDQVSQLPSQYQASAYSALAAASKSVAAIQPSNSAGASTSAANSNSASIPLVVGALVATAVLASLF